MMRCLRHCLLVLACDLAMPVAQAQRAPESAGVTRRTAPLRLPLLVGGLLTEAAAIGTDRNVPYLGIGFAAQDAWGSAVGLAAGELALMTTAHVLRRGVGDGDLARYPARDDAVRWQRGSGVSPAIYARYQLAELARHSAYYTRMSDVSLAWRRAWRRSVPSAAPLDSASPWRLLRAPVTWRDVGTAPVLLPVVAAAGSAWLSARGPRTLAASDSLRVLGVQTGRVRGALLAMGFEAAALASTAVGEELFFRGMVQTEVMQRAGPGAGLASSTASFALFHLPRHGVKGALLAGVAGAYFGERMRRTGNLRELVAMHFWIDFLPTAINIVRDPRSARAVDAIRWR